MLNFNTYRVKFLQRVMSFLVQCEAEGITDIRFVRSRLADEIHRRYKQHRPMSPDRRDRAMREQLTKSMDLQPSDPTPQSFTQIPCPECGATNFVLQVHEGVTHLDCRKCTKSWEIK